MSPELHRTILEGGRTAVSRSGGLIVASGALGAAYLAGQLGDVLGFGKGPIIAMVVVGFCAGYFASLVAYEWLKIKLSPPPLQPSEIFNEAGSR